MRPALKRRCTQRLDDVLVESVQDAVQFPAVEFSPVGDLPEELLHGLVVFRAVKIDPVDGRTGNDVVKLIQQDNWEQLFRLIDSRKIFMISIQNQKKYTIFIRFLSHTKMIQMISFNMVSLPKKLKKSSRLWWFMTERATHLQCAIKYCQLFS